MNFRQFADQLMLLRHHPLEEVRDIAEKTEAALKDAYPSSFCHERFENTEKYNQTWMQNNYYYTNDKAHDFTLLKNGIDLKDLEQYKKLIQNRPFKTELPPMVAECGMMQYEFLLDFGSFRDLQRHRAIVQRMPLLTRGHGFSDWYLDALPQELKTKTQEFIKTQEEAIAKLEANDEIKQYYTAMGYNVPCRVAGDLKALIYLVELRSTRFVHPTLVRQILKMIASLKEIFADIGLVIHTDDEPNRFDIRRGEHDIVMKD